MATPSKKPKDSGGKKKKTRRRATLPAPEGTDPTPEPEPQRLSGDENTERLRRDRPPHWG